MIKDKIQDLLNEKRELKDIIEDAKNRLSEIEDKLYELHDALLAIKHNDSYGRHLHGV